MKNFLKENKRTIFTGIILVIAGFLLGWLIFGGGHSDPPQEDPKSHNHKVSKEDGEKNTTWTCSMHPQIKEPEPGKCPICGMDLIPVSKTEEDGQAVSNTQLKMTQSAVELANIQTTGVKRKRPVKKVYLPGTIKPDERRISVLTARFPGRIEKLEVNFTGQKVIKGELLATIYSPELVTAQKELFEAIKFRDSNPEYYRAARNKLKLWDLTRQQIDRIEQQGEPQFYFKVVSPLKGTVTKRHVAIGDYVKEGTKLFEVIDLGHLWVMFDAYESDLPWITMGGKINFTIKSIPGKSFSGKITFIDPVINAGTRVAEVRAELDNPKDLLKPGMFASGKIHAVLPGKGEKLVIPKTSVLWTGKRSIVYVKVPEFDQPTFEFREIVLGEEAGDFYVVQSGLKEGDEVVSNGVFKVDAAIQLQGKPSMMNTEGAPAPSGHQHGGKKHQKSPVKDNSGHDDQGAHYSPEKEKSVFHVKQSFRDRLRKLYSIYLQLKNALVADDPEVAGKATRELTRSFQDIDMNMISGEAHQKWMEYSQEINASLKGLLEAGKIKEHRKYFARLTESLYNSLKIFGVKKEKVYYQYCPMALSNKGAYWLSEHKEIKNPYFGEQMLTCGETKEIIQD